MSKSTQRQPESDQQAQGTRHWSDVFSRSSRGTDVVYVKGSREIHEGDGFGPPGAEERWMHSQHL